MPAQRQLVLACSSAPPDRQRIRTLQSTALSPRSRADDDSNLVVVKIIPTEKEHGIFYLPDEQRAA